MSFISSYMYIGYLRHRSGSIIENENYTNENRMCIYNYEILKESYLF